MKKATLLLLAALMVLTCFAFASCTGTTTDNTSTSSTGSAVSNESKTQSVAGTSSDAATSSEKSEAASSAATSEETSEATASADTSAATSADTSAATSEPEPDEDANPLWLTHYNDGTYEGAGVIFLSSDNASAYWDHIAFKPVDAEKGIYEITEISRGAKSGKGVAITIPQGGFVYGINVGNDYPTLLAQDPDNANYKDKPNYTSKACSACINAIESWTVGMKIKFTGLNLDTLKAPTETPDKQWYEEGYVCTATWKEVK